MNRRTPGLPVHHQFPEFTQTHIYQVGDAIQPSHPLSFPSPPAPNPSQHWVFSNESTLCMRWPNYWSFSFSISPSKEHPGLISFRMDWLDLLEVQGTLKSLLQHHSSKASILWRSAFFTVQLSHPYMTTGKTIALTRQTFVGNVVSLLFNILSRLDIREGNGTPLQHSCLENPMDGGAWWAAVHGVAKSWTRLNDFTFTHWRRKWQPTPLLLPGESQGQGSLVGCRLWGLTESDTTDAT